MERVDVDRGSLAATVLGPEDGPRILLVCGGGADHRSWVRLLPEVAHDDTDRNAAAPISNSLATANRVAVFDQAGIGHSSAVTPAETSADYATDAMAVGTALLGDSFTVIGMSLGGMAAQHMAIAHPERIERLVLVATIADANTFVPPPSSASSVPEDRRSFSTRFPIEHRPLFEHLQGRESRVSQDPSAELAQVTTFLSHDLGERLRTVACPTTILCGDEDRTFPIENSRRLCHLIPRSRLVELAGVGHAVHFEAPASIVDATG